MSPPQVRGRVYWPLIPRAQIPQLLRFLAIGAVSTLAYLGLYVALRSAILAQAANVVALVVTTVANTAANRRFTFAVRGRERAVRHQMQGLVILGVALALTSGSLFLLHTSTPHASRGDEVAVLTASNLLAILLRYVLLRIWVFRDSPTEPDPPLADLQ